ncbi:MAG: glycogen synthase GlgA [Christensenellaceae bacterium]|nr:glycogen synthase GlgA [Christensenellaceae bacterium]
MEKIGPTKVLMAAFEAVPFAKTGGLGDVAGSLPKYLKKEGVDIRVIMPKFLSIPEKYVQQMEFLCSFTVSVGWRNQYCGLFRLEHEGVTFYFVDNEYYFKRDKLYGYYDDAERVAYFSNAVLRSIAYLENFKPDVIHCNDWHTALIPVFLKEFYGGNPFYYDIRTMFTIHNLKFQGVFGKEIIGDVLGLAGHTAAEDCLDSDDAVNCLKAALFFTDVITTVSPTYAEEIKYEFFGEGLGWVMRLRSGSLHGILNGIDYDEFNPETDRALHRNYNRETREEKIANKTALQRELGLPVREDVPMAAIVTRLTEQKGLDLLLFIADELVREDIQLVVLGTGEEKYEKELRALEKRNVGRVSAQLLFDEGLSRRIYAASDMFIMPSRFEPCGLSQIISMRYGTLPVVRETGGLKDTVTPYNEYTGEGTGFSFRNYNAHELLFTVKRAARLYRENKPAWDRLVTQAMDADFSWESSAKKYKEIYEELAEK